MADLSGINRLAVPSMTGTTPTREDYKKLQDYMVDLTEELKQILGNLDGDNMTSAFNTSLANPFASMVDNTQNVLSKKAIKKLIAQAGDSIRGYAGGNFLMTTGEDGQQNGFMIMDTPDQDTATKSMWLNLKGICYQDVSGTDGAHISSEISDYQTVWSFEQGGFAAEWIVAGALNASLITAGILQDVTGDIFYLNFDTGELRMNVSALQISGKDVETTEGAANKVGAVKDELYDEIKLVSSGNLLPDSNFESVAESDVVSVTDGVLKFENASGYSRVNMVVADNLYPRIQGARLKVCATLKQVNLQWLEGLGGFVSLICYVKYEDASESFFEIYASRSQNEAVTSMPTEYTNVEQEIVLENKTIETMMIYIDTGHMSGCIYTKDWKLAVVSENELTHTNVFNALTNNGALQGIYIENSNLYVNASYIKTGELDAGLVNVKNLNASNITSGEIDANLIKTGELNADLITAGYLNANHIRAGKLVGGIDATEPGEDGTSVHFSLDDAQQYFKNLYRVSGVSIAQTMVIDSSGIWCQNNGNSVFELKTSQGEDGVASGTVGVGNNVGDMYSAYMRGSDGYMKCETLWCRNATPLKLYGESVTWISVKDLNGNVRAVLGKV